MVNEKHEHCPFGYSSVQGWCDWRNAEMARDDVEWIVGPSGSPMLVDRGDWSARHARELAAIQERERAKHNHRIKNPIQ